MELLKVFKEVADSEIIVEATVPTGFEFTALDECKEKCHPKTIFKEKGRIFFCIPIEKYYLVKSLRSVDNINLLGHVGELKWTSNKEEDINSIKETINQVDWALLVDRWSVLFGFDGIKFPSNDKEEVAENVLKFRVTCSRNGTHSFSSMDAAANFGGTLQDKFKWRVDLTQHDLVVNLNIAGDYYYVSAVMTKSSLHRRNIAHFGATTLRSTIAYNLLRVAEPVPGDIVLDPLVGTASIPIEGALGFKNLFCFGGDRFKQIIDKARLNVEEFKKKGTALPIDISVWEALKLPLRDSCADVIVSDLPFGRRIGRKKDNVPFYFKFLYDVARVVKPKTGRSVLLTSDHRAMYKALPRVTYWKQVRTFKINQGGLGAFVFLLLRSAVPWVPRVDKPRSSEKRPKSQRITSNELSSSDPTRASDDDNNNKENVAAEDETEVNQVAEALASLKVEIAEVLNKSFESCQKLSDPDQLVSGETVNEVTEALASLSVDNTEILNKSFELSEKMGDPNQLVSEETVNQPPESTTDIGSSELVPNPDKLHEVSAPKTEDLGSSELIRLISSPSIEKLPEESAPENPGSPEPTPNSSTDKMSEVSAPKALGSSELITNSSNDYLPDASVPETLGSELITSSSADKLPEASASETTGSCELITNSSTDKLPEASASETQGTSELITNKTDKLPEASASETQGTSELIKNLTTENVPKEVAEVSAPKTEHPEPSNPLVEAPETLPKPQQLTAKGDSLLLDISISPDSTPSKSPQKSGVNRDESGELKTTGVIPEVPDVSG